MPRVTLTYDNGASNAYAEAAQTTDRQLLFVPITPATSAGQIKMTLSSDSDATGTDVCVYFDDVSLFLPP